MIAVMKLLEYLKLSDKAARKRFAADCGTSIGHLNNLAYGYKPINAALAIAIERETRGVVTVEELRPDVDWSVIRRRRPAARAA